MTSNKSRNICCKANYTELPGSITFNLKCGKETFVFSGPLSPKEDAFKDFDGDGDADLKDYDILTDVLIDLIRQPVLRATGLTWTRTDLLMSKILIFS